MTASPEALDRLPSDARARLHAFAAALERVPVHELGLYEAELLGLWARILPET